MLQHCRMLQVQNDENALSTVDTVRYLRTMQRHATLGEKVCFLSRVAGRPELFASSHSCMLQVTRPMMNTMSKQLSCLFKMRNIPSKCERSCVFVAVVSCRCL